MANEEMRELSKRICRKLSKNELIGLYLMILGEHDCRTLDIWPKIRPLFMPMKGKQPIMHQDALVGMGDVAKERRLKEKGK